MKTITFYSYKGGVGRSLALSNMAIKLSQLNKKVFVIDFDLEAPGLQFKFEEDYEHLKNKCQLGLVDYIHGFANENILPESLQDYICELRAKNINDTNIQFLSAGNFEQNDYWRKLATTKWSQLFYSKNSYGIRFFLDLKAKIEKEYNPDYLLIDSRTGITDISGITLKIFADEIVILAVNNTENLFGTNKIITSLTSSENELLNHSPKIHFVLTRLPFPKEPEEKAQEFTILKRWEKEIFKSSNGKIQDVSIIHTDKQVDHKEIVKIGDKAKVNTITYDYLNLFEKLIDGNLSSENETKFEAEHLFNKALIEKDSLLKLELLNKAILLDPSRYEYFKERGFTYFLSRQIDQAISDFSRALEIKPGDTICLLYLGNLFYNKQDHQKAIEYLTQIDYQLAWKSLLLGMAYNNQGNPQKAEECFTEGIQHNPEDPELRNARADILRRKGNYEDALIDIYKAIELAPDKGIWFATLAEILLNMDKKEEFYLNFNLALSKNINESQLRSAKDLYAKLKDDERFLELLEKYQLDINEILKD